MSSKARIAKTSVALMFAIVCWFGESVASAAPLPILEYLFDQTGTTSTSTGTDITPVEFRNAANAAADMHSAAGLGVAGDLVGHALFGVDRAFDNTASTAMGNAGVGGVAMHAADSNVIDALASWTVSGWFKTDGAAAINGFARLVFNRDSNGFHLIGGNTGGTVRVAVDGTEAPDQSGYGATQKWLFFAVSYDGTISSNNVKYYAGYRNATEAGASPFETTLIATRTIDQSVVNQDALPLAIGNVAARNRPFDGYLDNIRIHGAADNSGALSLADLEGLRAGDMAPVPEPASMLLGLIGVATLLVVKRRRR